MEENETTIINPVTVSIEDIENFVIEAGSDHVQTFGGKFEGGSQIQQIADEIAPCIHAILESGHPIKAYLEIGACAGGTVFLMNQFLKPEKIVLIDNNRHPKHHIRPYILTDIEHIEIIGDSHAQGTIDALKLTDIIFDCILVDGDHSYPGCKMDVDIYREFLNDGGFIILHDSQLKECGVKQVVEEMKADEGFEFIGEYLSEKHTHVLGVALFRKVD
jgi:hypothetical protein